METDLKHTLEGIVFVREKKNWLSNLSNKLDIFWAAESKIVDSGKFKFVDDFFYFASSYKCTILNLANLKIRLQKAVWKIS